MDTWQGQFEQRLKAGNNTTTRISAHICEQAGIATSARYFGVQFYLEDRLECPIDLVTEKALRPKLRPYVEQEMMRA